MTLTSAMLSLYANNGDNTRRNETDRRARAHSGSLPRSATIVTEPGRKAAMSERVFRSDSEPGAQPRADSDTLPLVPDGDAVAAAMQWLEGIGEREQRPVKLR